MRFVTDFPLDADIERRKADRRKDAEEFAYRTMLIHAVAFAFGVLFTVAFISR